MRVCVHARVHVRACVRVCVCGRNELNIYTTLAYPRISSFRTIHKHARTRIVKPFEDSELTGLKVDIAGGWESHKRWQDNPTWLCVLCVDSYECGRRWAGANRRRRRTMRSPPCSARPSTTPTAWSTCECHLMPAAPLEPAHTMTERTAALWRPGGQINLLRMMELMNYQQQRRIYSCLLDVACTMRGTSKDLDCVVFCCCASF